jgi:hypothetical protein
MTTIVTDYTEKVTENTLCGAPLTRYRLAHWLVDILKNFMSDPINIRDNRLSVLLNIQDSPGEDFCKSLFIVDVPYNTDTRKACTTPAIVVSVGETQYPMSPLNNGIGNMQGAINARTMYERTVLRSMTATITIMTESCDGTLLLADIIEDFLVRVDLLLPQDGMIQRLNLIGGSTIRKIGTGEGLNAKDIYQLGINISVIGGITWTADTQGPVFRGLTGATNIK